MTVAQVEKVDHAPVALGMPTIAFGPRRISRLICGANPFSAGSHLSWFVNQEMTRFYTLEPILKTLRPCQEVGINCWQSSPGGNWELYRRFRQEGGEMHFVSLGDSQPEMLPVMAAGGCIGIAHHGETTDRLFKAGKFARKYGGVEVG